MTTLDQILNALKESGCFVGDIDDAIDEVKAKDERIKELNEAYAKALSNCHNKVVEVTEKNKEIAKLKAQLIAQPTPDNIIEKIRNSFYHATVVYTRGSCGQLYKILKDIFPDAEAYENGDHVITKIGYTFYDIHGKVSQRLLQDFKPCQADNEMLSNRFGNDLQHIQCPNCDEVFYCCDEDEKDKA